MAKGKRSGAASGPHKNHGPKRRMFSSYGKVGAMSLAKCGVLGKYDDRESWALACVSRGYKNVSDTAWREFCGLKTTEAKHKWFESVSKR